MLNIGFSELLIIGAVGLIVIGPQRLPQTARFIGHFLGRVQRQVASVKSDIKREMALEDMKKIHREYEQTAKEVSDVFADTAKQVREAENDIMAKAVAFGKEGSDESNESSADGSGDKDAKAATALPPTAEEPTPVADVAPPVAAATPPPNTVTGGDKNV